MNPQLLRVKVLLDVDRRLADASSLPNTRFTLAYSKQCEAPDLEEQNGVSSKELESSFNIFYKAYKRRIKEKRLLNIKMDFVHLQNRGITKRSLFV